MRHTNTPFAFSSVLIFSSKLMTSSVYRIARARGVKQQCAVCLDSVFYFYQWILNLLEQPWLISGSPLALACQREMYSRRFLE